MPTDPIQELRDARDAYRIEFDKASEAGAFEWTSYVRTDDYDLDPLIDAALRLRLALAGAGVPGAESLSKADLLHHVEARLLEAKYSDEQ